MDLSQKEILYKIMTARDKRYDGRFYCGVHTTGIYCRPICPARPKIENISFYRSAAEAENAGFRPCLRCRPDLAPNSVQWSGTAAVVGRALTMISRGEADEISFGKFAGKLGVSDRHLRRLFEEHVGASPIDVATSKRLHLAKHLLTQSSLPVTQVAFASGYKSIRRFNDAFKEKFRSSPSQSRKSVVSNSKKDWNFIRVELPVIMPFDWEHLFKFLGNHHVPGVESFSDQKYQRGFSIGEATGAIEVSFDPKRKQLSAAISLSEPVHLRTVIEKVRDLFDTRTNPHAHLHDLNVKDPIGQCYQGSLGIRIPGAWEPFETAVCIILGQLVSVEQARRMVKKLVAQFGAKISHPLFEGCTHLFPTAKTLAQANLKDIGIITARANAIKELARQVLAGKLDLSRSADIKNSRAQLLAIKGIGPWTTEMIAMRCLGDVNAFPGTDLIVKRALQQHQQEKGDWSPWNAYVALALWKKYAGILSKKKRRLAHLKR